MKPPSKPLRVLVVEDVDDDAALIVRALRNDGWSPEWERVESPEGMLAALERQSWDLVLSDFAMPRFSPISALKLLQERGLDVPCIIISGTIGEDAAVEAMRAGVHDYLLKGKLGRLSAVVERELRAAAQRAETRRLQEQLLITDRLAVVGTLAAGVAHEINNPLTYINLIVGRLTSLEARRAHDALSQHRLELLEEVRDGLRRVERIASDLRNYSRNDDSLTAEQGADVHHVLESALRIASHEIRQRATLVRDFADVPLVRGSSARLGQVFLNLLMNAAQSMERGRADVHRLRVSTALLDDGRVAVEISDTGVGIPAETLGQIFKPFFTTKRSGEGTGLGLSICRGIVDGLGGEIIARSAVGRGTTFQVVLAPLSPGP